MLHDEPHPNSAHIQWLSGAIVTPLNMFVFPWLWYGTLLAVVAFLWVRFRHFPDLRSLGIFGIMLLAMTVFVAWVSSRTKRVGICDGRLVISNYRRTVFLDYREVEAVENVWWYWRRLVRLRFRAPTEFGEVVYYIPKWSGFMWLVTDPTQELRERIRDHDALAPWRAL